MPRLLVIGTLIGLATPAWAQDDAPRLAIVGLHQEGLDPVAQEAAVGKIAEAVDVTGKADGMETDDLVRAISGREEVILADALLANGRQDLLNGKNLYNQAQTEDAITALQSAVETLSVAVRATNSVQELWEAWVYLGTAHLQAGDAETAESCFRAAAALNPDRNPNAAFFPPDVVAAFNNQRTVLSQAAVTFTITAGEGSTIFMDGREIGSSPAAVAGVYPGMHHIVAKGEGVYGYELVRVDQAPDGKAPDVALAMGEPVLGSGADSPFMRSRQIAGLYEALGKHADDVDLLLLAGVEQSQLHLQLYSPLANAFSNPVRAALTDSAGDLAANNIPTLMEMVTTDGKIMPDKIHPTAVALGLDTNAHLASLLLDPREPAALTSNEPVVGPPPKKKSPVVPIIVGVLAAGAAGTGGYFGYTALRGDDPRYGGSVVIGPLAR